MRDLREASIGELLKELSEQTSTLIRQEMQLARVELVEAGKKAGAGAGLLGASTILALGAFGALTATLIAVIALALPVWAAALIITVVYGAGAAIIAMSGKKKIEAALPLAPQTTETLKEDVQWAKTRAISAQR